MDSMVFYKSFYYAVKGLKAADQLKVYNAIFAYALDEEEPKLTGTPEAIFTLIKPQIDANARRKANAKKGADYGKLGGRPAEKENPIGVKNSENKNPIGVLNKTPVGFKKSENKNPIGGLKKTPNVNDNVNVNANVNVNVNVNDNENENENDNVNASGLAEEFAAIWGISVNITPKRHEMLETLLERYTRDEIIKCFRKAHEAPFLLGDNKNKWKATFDWLIDEENFCKVLEGNYDPRQDPEDEYTKVARKLMGG